MNKLILLAIPLLALIFISGCVEPAGTYEYRGAVTEIISFQEGGYIASARARVRLDTKDVITLYGKTATECLELGSEIYKRGADYYILCGDELK